MIMSFPSSSVGQESICNAEDPDSNPGSGRSTGEGIGYPLQYSWASLVAQLVKNPPAMRETWVQSLCWEDPLEKGKATHSSILAWRIPWTISPWGCKELDMTEQLSQLDSKLFENQASPAFGSFLSFETLSYIQQQSFPRYLGSHREIIHVLLHSDSYPSPQSSVCIWAFFILLRSFLAWATSLSFLLIFYFLYTPRGGLGLAYVIDKVRL